MLHLARIGCALLSLLSLVSAAPPVKDQDPISVENKYIITLKEGADADTVKSHMRWVTNLHARSLMERETRGVEKHYKIEKWQAYSGEFDKATIAEIRSSPDVADVEQEVIFNLPHVDHGHKLSPRSLLLQQGATYGLAAISHRNPGSRTYVYDSSAGKGTYAYIIDTGVMINHSDFQGRASLGWTAFRDAKLDTAGHGTHVAGTIGSRTYGVAKAASLIAVKVFKGAQTTTAIILDGIQWAVNDIQKKGRLGKSVLSMSLGGQRSQAFNDAVEAAYQLGIISVVAAGNEAANASDTSPASAANALTVGAVDESWTQAAYSNFGPVLDLYAPGSNVLSTWIGNDRATAVLSGTSMATPHVAGLVLYLLALDPVGAATVEGRACTDRSQNLKDPVAVVAKIKTLATPDKITGVSGGGPNLLAYNDSGQ